MRQHGKELVLCAVRVLRILFRFFECVFGLFALGDVANGAKESRRTSGVIEKDAPLFLEPAFPGIIHAGGSILDFIVAAAARAQNFAHGFVNDVAIVRMNGFEVGGVPGFGAGGQSE